MLPLAFQKAFLGSSPACSFPGTSVSIYTTFNIYNGSEIHFTQVRCYAVAVAERVIKTLSSINCLHTTFMLSFLDEKKKKKRLNADLML